jgi:hypothetical protein
MEKTLDCITKSNSETINEIILVTNQSKDFRIRLKQKYSSIRFVDIDSNKSIGAALKEAVKLSSGEVLIFLEDHIEIVSGCFEDIIEIYNRDEDVVCVGFKFIPTRLNLENDIGYSIYFSVSNTSEPAGEKNNHLVTNDISYKKNYLMRDLNNLEYYLNSESVLQTNMLQNKKKIYLSDSVIIKHFHPTTWRHTFSESFWASWVYSASMIYIKRIHIIRRLIMSAAVYIKPFFRIYVLLKNRINLHQYGIKINIKFIVYAYFLLLYSALGESLGYLLKFHNSAKNFNKYLLNTGRIPNKLK